jgi:hypothetical protein
MSPPTASAGNVRLFMYSFVRLFLHSSSTTVLLLHSSSTTVPISLPFPPSVRREFSYRCTSSRFSPPRPRQELSTLYDASDGIHAFAATLDLQASTPPSAPPRAPRSPSYFSTLFELLPDYDSVYRSIYSTQPPLTCALLLDFTSPPDGRLRS